MEVFAAIDDEDHAVGIKVAPEDILRNVGAVHEFHQAVVMAGASFDLDVAGLGSEERNILEPFGERLDEICHVPHFAGAKHLDGFNILEAEEFILEDDRRVAVLELIVAALEHLDGCVVEE